MIDLVSLGTKPRNTGAIAINTHSPFMPAPRPGLSARPPLRVPADYDPRARSMFFRQRCIAGVMNSFTSSAASGQRQRRVTVNS